MKKHCRIFYERNDKMILALNYSTGENDVVLLLFADMRMSHPQFADGCHQATQPSLPLNG